MILKKISDMEEYFLYIMKVEVLSIIPKGGVHNEKVCTGISGDLCGPQYHCEDLELPA
jgi:hypothetical protein